MTQQAIKWPFSFSPHPTSASVLPGENKTGKILYFYSMRYHYLIKIMHSRHIFQISSTLVESLSNCLVVQLLTVNIWKIGHLCKHRQGDTASLLQSTGGRTVAAMMRWCQPLTLLKYWFADLLDTVQTTNSRDRFCSIQLLNYVLLGCPLTVITMSLWRLYTAAEKYLINYAYV